MEDFRKFLAARLEGQQKEGEAHPAADWLTAFAEGRLGSGERKRVLAHLAVCGECRDVVALAAGDVLWEPASKELRARWWNLRWATALAAACVVGVVIWHLNSVPPAVEKPATPVQSAEGAPKGEAPKPEAEKPLVVVAARPKVRRPVAMQMAVQSPVTPRAVAAVPDLPAPPVPSADEMAKAGQDTPLATEPLEALKAAPQPMVSAHAMAFQESRPALMKALEHMPRQRSLWGIAANSGMLRKSADGGKTWTTIPIRGQTNFLALWVSGADVWAGGDGGELFHSTDDGSDWKEVPVTDGKERLSESITGIETRGLQVKVRTGMGRWLSGDGGVSWRKIGE